MSHARSQPAAARFLPVGRWGVRGAFTLVEMLVSLAVLGVALAVVGVVFTITVDTTRQASAYADVQANLQRFMTQLEEDLKYCEPSQSVLVIVGRTQAAARTADDLAARKYYRVLVGNPAAVPGGFDPEYSPTNPLDPAFYQYSNPRADILMFFTNRPTISQAPPANPLPGTFGEACLNGAKFAPIEVVYGHAALAEARFNGTTYDWPLFGSERHIEQTVAGLMDPDSLSQIPLTQWHLSRRATILRDPGQIPPLLPQDIRFLPEASRHVVRGQPYNDGYEDMPGDAARFNLALFLEQLSPQTLYPPSAADWNWWCRPYDFPQRGWPLFPAPNPILTLLYADQTEQYHHVATVIEHPPAELASNLALHLLPACAWFQVEFLMPEDPRNSLEYDDPTPGIAGDYSHRAEPLRWTQVDPGETYVFIPDTPENRELIANQWVGGPPTGRLAEFARIDQNPAADASGLGVLENRRIRMWPYAIRVTVRVFDPQGRLDKPVVRSLVHRFD